MSHNYDHPDYPDLISLQGYPNPESEPAPNYSAGFRLSEIRGMSIRAGWHPRDEAEQLEADIQDEMYRLRREARAKRITKEAKKRIRKEGK